MKSMQNIHSIRSLFIAVLCGAIALGGAYAAETTPPHDADAKTKALEERVKQLEKRIADMEANEAKNLANPSKNFKFEQHDFNKMFDQMRKEMMDPNAPFGWDRSIPQAPGMLRQGRKPALGVGVDEVSEELKTRFKNEIKEGAFVLNIYPNSAAEKAGILVGDAITSFDGKAIANPKALIDAVKSAAKGSHEILLSRRGEMLKFKVELGSQDVSANEDPLNFETPGGNKAVRMELRVSALE